MKTYTITCDIKEEAIKEQVRKLSSYRMFLGGHEVYGFESKSDVMKAEKLILDSKSKVYKNGKLWEPPAERW